MAQPQNMTALFRDIFESPRALRNRSDRVGRPLTRFLHAFTRSQLPLALAVSLLTRRDSTRLDQAPPDRVRRGSTGHGCGGRRHGGSPAPAVPLQACASRPAASRPARSPRGLTFRCLGPRPPSAGPDGGYAPRAHQVGLAHGVTARTDAHPSGSRSSPPRR
jgi:hypothetical protein